MDDPIVPKVALFCPGIASDGPEQAWRPVARLDRRVFFRPPTARLGDSADCPTLSELGFDPR